MAIHDITTCILKRLKAYCTKVQAREEIHRTNLGSLEFDNVKFEDGISHTFLNVSLITSMVFKNLELDLREIHSICVWSQTIKFRYNTRQENTKQQIHLKITADTFHFALTCSNCTLVSWKSHAVVAISDQVIIENSTLSQPQRESLMGFKGKAIKNNKTSGSGLHNISITTNLLLSTTFNFLRKRQKFYIPCAQCAH